MNAETSNPLVIVSIASSNISKAGLTSLGIHYFLLKHSRSLLSNDLAAIGPPSSEKTLFSSQPETESSLSQALLSHVFKTLSPSKY